MFFVRQTLRFNLSKRLSQYSLDLHCKNLYQHRLWRLCSSSTLTHPIPDGAEKVYPAKIQDIVGQIAKLTLIEAADLNECLKKTLNIKDVPMMMGAPVAAPSAAAVEDDEVKVEKSSFTVKLVKYEDTKKVAVIKEIKSMIEGLNLVQAKKFVESLPQIVKGDIGKDEADKLKTALEAVGATCEIS